jgi:hypothetical protein
MSLNLCVRTRKILMSDALKHLWIHLVSVPALRHVSSHVLKRLYCQFWIADDWVVRGVRSEEWEGQSSRRLKFRKEQTGLNEPLIVCVKFWFGSLVCWLETLLPPQLNFPLLYPSATIVGVVLIRNQCSAAVCFLTLHSSVRSYCSLVECKRQLRQMSTFFVKQNVAF